LKFKLLDDAALAYLTEYYPKLGTRAVASKLGLRHRYIEHVAQELKLKISDDVRSAILVDAVAKDPSEYAVNHEQFVTVQKPEVAYWLGMFWADGNIDTSNGRWTVRISIKEDDAVNLADVSRRIGDFHITREIYTYRNNRLKIATSNKFLVAHLLTLGYGPNRFESADRAIAEIPENLKHYWFRGLSDGDGCFRHGPTSRYWALSSGIQQDWSYVIKWLEGLGITKYKIQRHSNKKGASSQIRIHNTNELLVLGRHIYSGYPHDGIGMPRKWDKFRDIETYADQRGDRWKAA
jgi:hypothetical protein